MKQEISKQQLQDDFKQVVLYFTCETIHKFFDDDPNKLFQALSDYVKVRGEFLKDGTTVSKGKYHTILRNLIRINFGLGIPRDLPKAMFRRGAKRCVLEYVDEMIENGELLKVLNNGRMPTKEKRCFTKKYMLPKEVLEDFFADRDLAKIKLENRRLYWTKRQNHFIGKELDRRELLKNSRTVCAVKKQTEQEDSELKEQVNAVLEEMDV